MFSRERRSSFMGYIQGEGCSQRILFADIFVTDITEGTPTRLTFDYRDVAGLTWTPDGQSIIFSSYRTGEHRIWKVPSQGGDTLLVEANGRDQSDPTLSSDGHLLLFTESTVKTNIWQGPISG